MYLTLHYTMDIRKCLTCICVLVCFALRGKCSVCSVLFINVFDITLHDGYQKMPNMYMCISMFCFKR